MATQRSGMPLRAILSIGNSRRRTGPIVRSSEMWRDPPVFRDPGANGWHLLISAREVHAAPNDDGVIAHARSRDLKPGSWITSLPGWPRLGFGQLEVLQNKIINAGHS